MDIDPQILWAVELLAGALVLFMVEVFVPSGGLLGFTAAVVGVIGLVMLFSVNTTLGLIAAIAILIALPILLGYAIKLWPSTPLARLLTLHTQQQRLTHSPTDGTTSGADDALLGSVGQAVTALRPVGSCKIDGRRLDCLSATGVIEAGEQVKVVSVDGMQIKVVKV